MKRVIAIGLGAVLLLVGCAAPAQNMQNTAAQSEKKPVYFLAGRIQASSAADLSAPFAARIQAILVEPGQMVKAGDPLVQFESADQKAAVDAAQAGYGVAQATLSKLQSAARPEQIRQTQAALDSAQIALDNARKNLERQQSLKEAGAASDAALETANAQYVGAEATFRSTQEALNILKNGDSKQAQAVQMEEVKKQKSNLEAAQSALNNRTLTAPFDGVITAKNLKAGETAASQTVILSIEAKDRLAVEAYGPASAVKQFKAGESVLVRIAEVPEKTFSGKVVYVSDTIDPKRRATLVKVSMDPAPELMTGMFAEIGLKR